VPENEKRKGAEPDVEDDDDDDGDDDENEDDVDADENEEFAAVEDKEFAVEPLDAVKANGELVAAGELD
jgi:hypothetical protein